MQSKATAHKKHDFAVNFLYFSLVCFDVFVFEEARLIRLYSFILHVLMNHFCGSNKKYPFLRGFVSIKSDKLDVKYIYIYIKTLRNIFRPHHPALHSCTPIKAPCSRCSLVSTTASMTKSTRDDSLHLSPRL